MGIFGGESDYLLIQKGLYFFPVCGRMDAGENNLAFPEHLILGGLKLFYLCHKVAGFIDFFCGVHKDSACFLIRFVGKSGGGSGLALHIDFVAVCL